MLAIGSQALQIAVLAVLSMFGGLLLATLARTLYLDFVSDWGNDGPKYVTQRDALLGSSDNPNGQLESQPTTEDTGSPAREQRSYDTDFDDLDWFDE